jgi:hypothetical protein
MSAPRPKGYLVFTTHDRDENDATFVPETETEIIEKLRSHGDTVSDDQIQDLFGRWADKFYKSDPHKGRWHTQTRCEFPWPFNDKEILGTFYHLVY